MNTFFVILWLLANVAMIFFIVKTIREKDKEQKKGKRKMWLIALVVAFVTFIGFAATSDSSDNTKQVSEEKHIYDDAQIIDMKNGLGTAVVGKVSVIIAPESECTEDALADWYFNHVTTNDCNFSLIVYDDKEETRGVYSNNAGFIQKDIALAKESDGTYRVGDDAGSIYYTCDSDTKSISIYMEMVGEDVLSNVKETVDSTIPDEYKGEGYSIDVAGTEGDIDCNIILVCDSFDNADYEKITTEIATVVKEANVGVGYFSIEFQTDQYKLIALGVVDDLRENISVKVTNF